MILILTRKDLLERAKKKPMFDLVATDFNLDEGQRAKIQRIVFIEVNADYNFNWREIENAYDEACSDIGVTAKDLTEYLYQITEFELI